MMPGVATSLQLLIYAEVGREHVPFLRRQLRSAVRMMRPIPPLTELSVALVGDARMARLHEQFLTIPGPTDVLTFELERDKRNRVTAGEIIICVPFARRAAAGAGTSLSRELLLYALHGVLHLCGHDDRTRDGFRRMHEMEDEILSRLGVGPVFNPHRSSARPEVRTPIGHRRARKGDRA